jgi:hypothetical protein
VTVSHVPQLPAPLDEPQLLPQPESQDDPQPESHVLAPHGLQPEAQGAEQHLLVFLPKQPPAWAFAVIATASANEKNKRMLGNSSQSPKTDHTTKNKT